MPENTDFERLVLLCRRSPSIPALPINLLRLIKEIDNGDAPNSTLGRIILSDPALTAAFMRWSAIKDPDSDPSATDCIANNILVLGHRAVRNLAVSIMVQGALRSPILDCDFDAEVCARHSVFVGILAQYIVLRPAPCSRRPANVADVFAAGVLHELPLYLLAKLAPNAYNRVHRYSQRHEVTMKQGFEMLYLHAIGELGAVACEAWNLPPIFARYMRCYTEPWMADELEQGVCAVRYADWMSNRTEWRIETWDVREELSVEVLEEIDFPEVEQAMVIPSVAAKADQYSPRQPIGKMFPVTGALTMTARR